MSIWGVRPRRVGWRTGPPNRRHHVFRMTQTRDAPKTVLVAALDPDVRRRYALALERSGLATIGAETADELLRHLQTPDTVDLLVLDLRLGASGVAAVQAARTLNATVPIVVLSGSVDSAADVRALAALGITSYINEHCAVEQILPSLAPTLFPNSFNRRTSKRMTLDIPVAYRFQETIATALTLNLSKGGLGIRTISPLNTGTKVHVTFRLPGSRVDIAATSRVAWSDQRAGMGLQFEEVGTVDQSSVDEFVDQHSITEPGTSS